MQIYEQKQQIGDKVRIKSGDHKGKRGLVTATTLEHTEVTLDDGVTIVVSQNQLTNYSLAARRAWQVMPKKTGRPKSLNIKKMVSVRVDAELWAKLGECVDMGVIPSREAMINTWIKDFLDTLESTTVR